MSHQSITVRVKPNAARSQLLANDDGSFIATLKSPPVDGKAKAELIQLVAAFFAVRRSAVTITAGAIARTKRVRIEA